MGVGISLSGLAGSVAAAGGVGTISGVEIGFNWPGYRRDRRTANREAMHWRALINAARGDLQDGFAFVGGQVHRCGKIVAVNEVMADLEDGMARFESG